MNLLYLLLFTSFSEFPAFDLGSESSRKFSRKISVFLDFSHDIGLLNCFLVCKGLNEKKKLKLSLSNQLCKFREVLHAYK